MEGVDCVDHQLEETVSKVRARVQDRNTGGGPETFFVLATAPFLLSHQVLASQKIILRIQVIPPILWSRLRHTSYLSILVHRRIIEVYKKYTKKLSELATK